MPGIAKVFFTGSVAVGRRVAAAAGARGCPVVLELGGKDPMLVFADADLDRAVDGALFASFLNAGQACVSAERIYVERSVYEDFATRLTERARALKLGEDVGPLISERQRENVESVVERSASRARRLVPRADRRPRRAARPGDLRPGGERRAVRRRRGCGPARERQRVRAGGERLVTRSAQGRPRRPSHRGGDGVGERLRLLVHDRPGGVGRSEELRASGERARSTACTNACT